MTNSLASLPKVEKRITLVPPDGGWGWMVLFGISLTNIFNQAMLSLFSLLYGDRLESMGHKTTGAALIVSIMLCVTNFGGPFAGALVKLTSSRVVCMTGCILVASGTFLSAFALDIYQLILTYSFLVGVGLGFIQNAAFVAINSYFKVKKSIAVGIAMTGTGIGQALMPHVVRYFLEQYGFTGSCVLLAALSLHGICGTMLIQPVQWHLKKIEEEVVVSESKQLLQSTDNVNKDGTDIKEDNDNCDVKKKSLFRKIYDLFDISLLKNPRFIIVILGIGLTYISVQNFGMLFPLFLQKSAGLNKHDTATCMSAVAFADVFGRLAIPQVQSKFNITARVSMVIICTWVLIVREILGHQTNLYALLVFSALYGFGRSMIIVNRNLAISEQCRTEQVPSAVGLGMLSMSIIAPPIGYFLGWVRDYTENYVLCITTQNALLLIFLLLWIPEMLHQRYQTKKRDANVI